MKAIKFYIFWLVLLFQISGNSQILEEYLVTDPYWSTVTYLKSSPDRIWTTAIDVDPNDLNRRDSLYLINIKTNELITRLYPVNFDFVNSTFLYLNKGVLEIQDLRTKKIEFLSNVKGFELIADLNAFVVHFDDGKSIVYDDENNELWRSNKGYDGYMLTSSKTVFFVIQAVNSYSFVSSVLLDEKKSTMLFKIKGKIKTGFSDNSKTNLAVVVRDSELKTEKLFRYQFEDNFLEEIVNYNLRNEHINTIDVAITANEELYILYFIKEKNKNIEHSYLDIWSTKDRVLNKKRNDNDLFNYIIKSYSYNIKSKKWHSLEKPEFDDFLYFNNPNIWLAFNTKKHKDFTSDLPIMDFYLYDKRINKIEKVVDSIEMAISNVFVSPQGNFIGYRKKHKWFVYDVATKNTSLLATDVSSSDQLVWDELDQKVFFSSEGVLWQWDADSKIKKALYRSKSKRSQLRIKNLHGLKYPKMSTIVRNSKCVKNLEPLLLEILDEDNNTSYIRIADGKELEVIDKTPNRINKIHWNKELNTFIYMQENYKNPPQIMVSDRDSMYKIKDSKLPKSLYLNRRQDVISYKNKHGEKLKGILYYPKNFKEGNKYPLITHIYQIQNATANVFDLPITRSATGFSISIFTDNDYFVYLPDIIYSDEGTGLSALDCVDRGLDALLKENKSIDPDRIGLHGHSHGGYETNFIVTQTNRFAAVVSGAGNSDIVHSYFSYNFNFRIPFYFQYENGQYDMNVPFAENKELYLRNSPIMFVDQVTTPILTWTGMQDENIHWEQTRTFFIGLLRNKVPHIALFYKNEGHSFMKDKEKADISKRTIDWFNYYLKDQKDISWINLQF